jgi:hypothetical protein
MLRHDGGDVSPEPEFFEGVVNRPVKVALGDAATWPHAA